MTAGAVGITERNMVPPPEETHHYQTHDYRLSAPHHPATLEPPPSDASSATIAPACAGGRPSDVFNVRRHSQMLVEPALVALRQVPSMRLFLAFGWMGQSFRRKRGGTWSGTSGLNVGSAGASCGVGICPGGRGLSGADWEP
jgi:hypothetical protein